MGSDQRRGKWLNQIVVVVVGSRVSAHDLCRNCQCKNGFAREIRSGESVAVEIRN